MVTFEPPKGMRFVWRRCKRSFENSDVLPVAWRQLTAMCWLRWRYRSSPVLPEMLETLYWRTLPRRMKKQWFEDWKRNGSVTALAAGRADRDCPQHDLRPKARSHDFLLAHRTRVD
jgi:hypothetical protein